MGVQINKLCWVRSEGLVCGGMKGSGVGVGEGIGESSHSNRLGGVGDLHSKGILGGGVLVEGVLD